MDFENYGLGVQIEVSVLGMIRKIFIIIIVFACFCMVTVTADQVITPGVTGEKTSARDIAQSGMIFSSPDSSGSLNVTGLDTNPNSVIQEKNNGSADIKRGSSSGDEDPQQYAFVRKWGMKADDHQFGKIAADQAGNIFTVDEKGKKIQKFNLTGFFLKEWGSEGSGDGQFKDGTDNIGNILLGIAVNTTGYVYVVDPGNNRVQIFNSNGDFVGKWGSEGSGTGQFNTPIGIAINSSDYVYVLESNNRRVQRFDSSGGFLSAWDPFTSGSEEYPTGIAIDNSGRVCIGSSDSEVLRFDCDGNYKDSFSLGGFDGYNTDIEVMAFDAAGNLYVDDPVNQQIRKYSPSMEALIKWDVGTSWVYCYGMTLDSSGNVYVSDTNWIRKYTPSGGLVDKWRYHKENTFHKPDSLALDSAGNVYVTDKNDYSVISNVQKYTGSGKFLWISYGLPNIENMYPEDIVVDKSNNIYVSDEQNDQMLKFNSNGGLLSNWSSMSSNFAIDTTGNFYFVFHGSKELHKCNSNGVFIKKWTCTNNAYGLYQPDIAINGSDKVFVTGISEGNIKTRVFNSNGDRIEESGLSAERIAFDNSGNIYSIIGSSICKYSPTWDLLARWGTPGSDNGQFSDPTDLAVDNDGYVYVLDSGNYRVQVFKPAVQPAPSITSISPSSGINTKACPVTITGTNFQKGVKVNLVIETDSFAASAVNLISSTTLTCTLPLSGKKWGHHGVAVINPDGQRAEESFYINSAGPMVYSLSPSNGYNTGNVAAVISGNNFKSHVSVTIKQGSTTRTAAIQQVTDTQIKCTLPLLGAPTGYYDLIVKNTDGHSDIKTEAFFINSAGAKPTIKKITPTSGYNSMNVLLTIKGTHFKKGATVKLTKSVVTKTGIVNQITSTQIKCTIPLANAPAGVYGLTVTNADKTSCTKPNAFTVKAAGKKPTIKAISPKSGLSTKSTVVTITGTNFRKGVIVQMFKGSVTKKATISSFTSKKIICTLPTKGALKGTWNVKITNSDGTTVTKKSGFTVKMKASTTETNTGSGKEIVTGISAPDSLDVHSSGNFPCDGVLVPVNGPVIQPGAPAF